MEDLQQEIPLRFHGIEIVGLGVKAAPPEQQVHQEGPEGHQKHGEDGLGQVPQPGPEQAEGHDGDPFDDDHEMDPVIADHPGQQQAVAVKAVGGHDDRHQRPQGSHEKAEGHEGPALFQHRDGDEDHIDIAQVQRQLPPPVEAAHGRRDAGIVLVHAEGILITNEAQEGHGAGRRQHRLFRPLALSPEEQARRGQQQDEACENRQIKGIEGRHRPGGRVLDHCLRLHVVFVY